MDDLTNDEKETLIITLEIQSEAIHRKFGGLVSNVERFLQKSDVTISNLQNFFATSGLKELAMCIEPTDTISKAIGRITAGNYWTFFNYELLESTVNTFCQSKDITTLLSSYITDFKVFCQRRLCEVPINALRSADSKPLQTFRVKLDTHFSINIDEIKKVQIRLSMLLGINILNLVDVAEGCVELTFRVHEKVDINQKLILTIEDKLANINIKWLQCGSETFQIKTSVLGNIPEESSITKGKGEITSCMKFSPRQNPMFFLLEHGYAALCLVHATIDHGVYL